MKLVISHTSVRLCGAVPVCSALAPCVLLVSFSQECRRHDCQKSSELSSAESRHDLEVRSWISRMRRLSGCAQGSKSSDSKPSRSAFRLLQQQGGAWHCGAVSRSGGGNTRCTVQGSESGHAVCTLDRRVRVEQYSASRGGVACMQGEAGAARAGEAFCACRALLRCARRQDWVPPRCRGVRLVFTDEV